MADSQWTMQIKIAELDKSATSNKSTWKAGDLLTLQIEPHATVNMAKQRIALIVQAHMKHQELSFGGCPNLDDLTKLQDIEGLTDGGTLGLAIKIPPEPEAPPVEVSDDEGLFKGEEPELPPLPSKDVLCKELSDEEMDKQGELKQQAADAMEDGDLEVAVNKFTDAVMLGGVSAMMIAKRAEMLLKQKRYKAVVADATVALELNPDSAKAYRARGKARRFLGEYEGAAADLSQAQRIDYDDGVAEMHQYLDKRLAKLLLKAKQDAKKAESETKAEAA